MPNFFIENRLSNETNKMAYDLSVMHGNQRISIEFDMNCVAARVYNTLKLAFRLDFSRFL